MISSVDEFILLLKKWSADGAKVRLIASFSEPQSTASRGILRLSGPVTGIEEKAEVFSIGDQEQSAMICFAGCRIGYGTGDDFQLTSHMADSEQLEDLVCLVTPSSLSICVYTVKEKNGAGQ
jgi:hypothetical protein